MVKVLEFLQLFYGLLLAWLQAELLALLFQVCDLIGCEDCLDGGVEESQLL